MQYECDKLHEECGIFGILDASGKNVANSIYYGLCALQHRGQESAGIAVCNTSGPLGNLVCHKDMGSMLLWNGCTFKQSSDSL